MHTKTAFVLLALASASSAAGVGCSSTGSGIPNHGNGPTGTAAARASLHRAKSCGDLLGDLKADAAYKVNKGVNREIETVQACMRKYGEDKCASYGGIGYAQGGGRAEATTAMGDSAAPSPPMASTAGGTADAKSSGATSFSSTNTQVKGVDEADIVKNDGKNLYVLHGRAFKVVTAWPAANLKEASTIDIEGQPTEMFVADGKVVVYSQVNGASIFAAAGVAPKQTYQDYGYGYAYAGKSAGVSMDMAMPSSNPYRGPGEIYAPLTKVTVLALNGDVAAVTRELYFEGSYLDARRVGPNVRTVFQAQQYGPKLKYSIYELYPQPVSAPSAPKPALPGADYQPVPPDAQPQPDLTPKTGSQSIAALEQLRAANLAAIDATQLGDWLPYTFVKNGAAVTTQGIACEDFYVPSVGSTQGGMTEIASIDLSDPASLPRQTAIFGQADTVYGSADTLYLAAHAWVEPPFMWNDPYDMSGSTDGSTGSGSTPPSTEASPPMPAPAPGAKSINVRPLAEPIQAPPAVISWSTNNTHLHKFEFATDAKFANYVASGTVSGSVKNQFSLDDKDGYLRIATTENRQYVTNDGKYVAASFGDPKQASPSAVFRANSVNHVYTLGQSGPWLDVVGDVGELAPNEQIYSVRFLGNRGYVVTFRQVDPLFVIDLSSPKTPTLLAALTIPGFSEYMHPLDDNHLLTIGRDASTTGRAQGLQLQVFDVTNGAKPFVQHKFTYNGQEYGQSDAEYDHKAFTYFAAKNLLAFPYYSNALTKDGIGGGMRSSLELFRVDLATGFSKLGSIDNTPLEQKSPTGYCGGYYGPSVRRGVFLENFVYSISYGGVVVKNANDLAAPSAQLPLANPLVNSGYGPAVCY